MDLKIKNDHKQFLGKGKAIVNNINKNFKFIYIEARTLSIGLMMHK